MNAPQHEEASSLVWLYSVPEKHQAKYKCRVIINELYNFKNVFHGN